MIIIMCRKILPHGTILFLQHLRASGYPAETDMKVCGDVPLGDMVVASSIQKLSAGIIRSIHKY